MPVRQPLIVFGLALMALVASFALASVAVMSTVDVQQGTKRDHQSKEAIAAADAGANIALLRLNRFLPNLSVSHPCIGPGGEYQTASAGWCPATATATVGNAVYSYSVSAYTGSGSIDVVSVGSSGDVSRRVNVALKTSSGKNVFAEERLIGQDEINLKGSFEIETSIGTNGNIFQDGGSGTICGNDRHGTGKEAPTPSCSGQIIEENREQYYRALRSAQGTLDRDESRLMDWLRFFLLSLIEQKNSLEQKLRNERLMTSLSAIDEQLLQIARQHGRVTLSSAMVLTNTNRNTLKLHLRQLVEAGHLRLMGRGRSSWYEMA